MVKLCDHFLLKGITLCFVLKPGLTRALVSASKRTFKDVRYSSKLYDKCLKT